MFKKLLSAAVALCMLCSVAMPLAMAESSFSDVISPDYDWAMDDIEEMTTLGIIKGYTDGTFRPANTIKRIEMLLLLARAAGYPTDENNDYQAFADYAEVLYESVLDEYDMGTTYNKYKPEVAFLLYKGILSVDELDSYLNNASSTVKRYEAAILLTKLMGAEDEVKQNTAVVLDYADYTEIPVSARAYVEYVTAQGLMNGIEDNNFGPDESVTRVQVTIMLRRIIDKLELSTETGIVKEVDADSNTVTLYNEDEKTTQTYTVNPRSVTILKNGFTTGLADIEADSTAIVVYRGSSIYSFEVIGSGEDETVTGRLSDITTKTSYTTFSVIDAKTGSSRSFMILASSEPEITYDGKECTFNKLGSGDTVTVTVEGGVVVSIEAESGSKTVEGVIKSISLSPDYSLSVQLYDDDGSTTTEVDEYSVDDDVTVTRNGSKSTLRSVLVGDSVTLTVESGIITKIVATSKSSTASGIISSIYIGTTSEIGIKSNGEENVYTVSSDATYTVSGSDATIYELRLGASVEAELESNSIVSITSSASASGTYQKTGVIEDINTSYGFINLSIDGVTEQIFVSKKSNSNTVTTTIIDSSGSSVSFSKLEEGQTITAIGSYSGGTFIATTIVVIS